MERLAVVRGAVYYAVVRGAVYYALILVDYSIVGYKAASGIMMQLE